VTKLENGSQSHPLVRESVKGHKSWLRYLWIFMVIS